MISREDVLKMNKYTVLQEAVHEINQLLTQYKTKHNLDIKIDINKLKEDSCKKFLYLTKTKPDDNGVNLILNDIKSAIDDDYSQLYQNLNTDLLASSSACALKEMIKIIRNKGVDEDDDVEEDDDEYYGRFLTANSFCKSLNEEEDEEEKVDDEKLELIQQKINAVLDKYPNKLLFNKDKLRDVAKSKTKLSEILASLESIIENPDMHAKVIEKPYSYVLYSNNAKSFSYVKSFSNILTGNCFFISLYGKQSCVHNILSLLVQNNKIKKHEASDAITIYGPLDIISYAKDIPNSFERLKPFNIDIPNLYFFEISCDEKDPKFVNWCQFISFISHATIFCSENAPKKEELKHFNDLSFIQTDSNALISCSPGEKIFPLSFDIKALNVNEFRDTIFQILIQKVDKFIPHETAEKYSQYISDSKIKFNQSDFRENFENDKINDYGPQVLNKSREYFDIMKNKMFQQFRDISQKSKYIEDFHLKTETIVNKILQYFYVNMNKKYWNMKNVAEISKVVVAEVEHAWYPISKIELIGQLLNSIEQNPKSFSAKSKEILEKLNKITPKDEIIKVPTSQKEINLLQIDLDKNYKSLVRYTLGVPNDEEMMDSISNQLYSYLNENPIASDHEYGKFYSDLYKKFLDTTKSPMVKKMFHFLLHIRRVRHEYKVQSYTVEIDAESFEKEGAHFESRHTTLELTPGSTCHELYELVKKTYNLKEMPFYITRTVYNKSSKNRNDVQIFNNNFPISKLKSNSFKVFYLSKMVRSTGAFLESMIVEKEIKIADDFIIRTSSKEAEFNVTYPPDHKGWFNVPFDITTTNPEKAFGEDGGALIYLKLSADEMNDLKEGNTVLHQSYQGDKWVTENDPVFLTYPKCNTAVILLRHCSRHRITRVSTDLDNLIPSNKKNRNHSRNWEHENGNIAYKRGDRNYYLPVSYVAEGILVDHFEENTCVAFHGTKAPYVPLIVGDRFKLPTERGGVEEDRIGLGISLHGKANWANAIFVSPSIKYAALYSDEPIIIHTAEHNYAQSGHVIHDLIRIIVLQVRVKPSAVEVFGNTTGSDIVGDHYTNDQLEWRIENPQDLFPYRLLTKDVSLQTYNNDYRRRI